jgi:hypothetical protein
MFHWIRSPQSGTPADYCGHKESYDRSHFHTACLVRLRASGSLQKRRWRRLWFLANRRGTRVGNANWERVSGPAWYWVYPAAGPELLSTLAGWERGDESSSTCVSRQDPPKNLAALECGGHAGLLDQEGERRNRRRRFADPVMGKDRK